MKSKKFQTRVGQLKNFKNAMEIFKSKIRYTQQPVGEVFHELSEQIDGKVGEVFSKSLEYGDINIGWVESLLSVGLELNSEDLEILSNLGNTLGRTDLEGQINQIELVSTFLDSQIEKAEKDNEKFSKMYKTLGIVTGAIIVILLI